MLTLPKKVRARLSVGEGDVLELRERDGGIFLAPISRLDPSLQEDVRRALEDLKTGNFIEFSSVKEFHKKRKEKWGRV